MTSLIKVGPLALAVALACATLVPSFASASEANEINHSQVANSTEALAKIEKIGLPMSDEMATDIRGGTWWTLFPRWMTELPKYCQNCTGVSG